MMENLLSLLKSVCATWLSFSSTTWAMDMILAFACGVGLFLLLLPFLPDSSREPPPPPLRKKNSRKYHMVKKDWSRMRKRSCTLKAHREFWEEGEETDDLESLLRSHLGNLLHGSRFYQFPRRDDSDETCPMSPRGDGSKRQPLEDILVNTSFSQVSQAPSPEHVQPPTSTLSPGLKTSPVSLGSQSPLSASSPPEPSIPLGCLSPQPFALSSSPLHSPGPMTSPPPLPDPSLPLPRRDSSPLPLGTIPPNSSPPNTRSLPSPDPAISILGPSGCPPISAFPQCQEPPRALCRSSLSTTEPRGGYLNPKSPVTSFLSDTPQRQVENGGSHFPNPDVQNVLEILITKKVQLKIYKNTKEQGQDIPLYSLGNMLKSLGKERDHIISQPFWKTKGEAGQLPASQELHYPKILEDHLQQKGSQLFWGLPILHSESLVDNTRVPDASLQFSPILFNGICSYVPAQIPDKVSPQIFSTQPLVHHVAQPQTFTPALPSSRPPSVSQKQTLEHVPSLPVVPCHSPQAMVEEVSSLKYQKGKQYPISPTIQHLQQKFLKEPEENRSLAPVVKKPQKVFSQPVDRLGATQENKSSVKLPVDVIYFKLREQLEQHLQKRFMCGLPQKGPLSLHREKDPGRRQAKENSGPSGISDKCSQAIQKSKSEHPEISQVGKHSSKDPGKAPKDLSKGLQNSLVNDLESICEPGSQRKGLRLLRNDSGNDSASGPDKKNLEDSVSIYASGKVEQTGGGIPVGVDHCNLTLERARDLPGKSNIPMKTRNEPSLQVQEYDRKTQDLSLFDPGTQQKLEAHMKRFWMRHRWDLALKVIKVMCMFKQKKRHASLLSQPVSSSSVSPNSKADSTCQGINFQGKPSERIPGEKVKAIMSVLEMRGPLTGRSFKSPMKTVSVDNHGPSESLPTARETSLTAQPHMYCPESRTWCPDTVSRPGRGSLSPSPISVMGRYQPQERGVVVSRDPSCHVLTGEMNAGSPYSKARDIQKTMETEAKKPFEWAVTKGASVMSTSQNLNVSVRSLKSVGSSKNLPSPRICTLQGPGDSCLGTQAESKKKSQDFATRVFLQDFATGKVLQDSASETCLTEDILASQAHVPNTLGVSSGSTSPSRGFVDLLMQERTSQGQKEPRISKFQDPQKIEGHMFAPRESGEGFVSPCRVITSSSSSPSRGICHPFMRDRMSHEQREPRMPKSQEPRRRQSNMFAPPEKRESFERAKAGGKEERFVGGRGLGGLTPPSQVREVRGTVGSKSLLLSEKKGSPAESTIGNRVRSFLQHIMPSNDRGEAESLRKAKPPASTTQSGGSGRNSRVVMDRGSMEAQVLMSTVGRILEEKMRLHNEFSASKENLQKGEPQVDRWSSCHKNDSFPEQKRMLSNTACGLHASPERLSHPMNMRLSRDRASNPAFSPREPGPLISHFHRRPMEAGASDHPVHCPRHCVLQKSVFRNQSCNASHIYPGQKSLLSNPVVSHTSMSCMG